MHHTCIEAGRSVIMVRITVNMQCFPRQWPKINNYKYIIYVNEGQCMFM